MEETTGGMWASQAEVALAAEHLDIKVRLFTPGGECFVDPGRCKGLMKLSEHHYAAYRYKSRRPAQSKPTMQRGRVRPATPHRVILDMSPIYFYDDVSISLPAGLTVMQMRQGLASLLNVNTEHVPLRDGEDGSKYPDWVDLPDYIPVMTVDKVDVEVCVLDKNMNFILEVPEGRGLCP